MKRQLNMQPAQNKGFFLPYTIFISFLVLLNVTTMIILYENHAKTNQTMNELVEIETLIQMTRAQFIREKSYTSSESGQINYTHPNGDVILSFHWIDDNTIEATTAIQTAEGSDVNRGFRLYLSEEETEE